MGREGLGNWMNQKRNFLKTEHILAWDGKCVEPKKATRAKEKTRRRETETHSRRITRTQRRINSHQQKHSRPHIHPHICSHYLSPGSKRHQQGPIYTTRDTPVYINRANRDHSAYIELNRTHRTERTQTSSIENQIRQSERISAKIHR